MTLANKITVLRILAVPLFVVMLFEHHLRIAQGVFVASVLSDALDGTLARLRGERTPLGTFLDPMADKLLLTSSYIAFTVIGTIPIWVFITVLSRDLLIVLGWTVVFILTNNRRIEPRPLGKLTTGFQMLFVVARLFNIPDPVYIYILYAMISATILSALDYLWVGNKRLGALE